MKITKNCPDTFFFLNLSTTDNCGMHGKSDNNKDTSVIVSNNGISENDFIVKNIKNKPFSIELNKDSFDDRYKDGLIHTYYKNHCLLNYVPH